MKQKNIDKVKQVARVILKVIVITGAIIMIASSSPSQKQVEKIIQGVMCELKKKWNTRNPEKNKQYKYYEQYVKKTIKRFVERGDLVVGADKILRLTKKGEQKLKRFELGNIEQGKPANWDGKFRVIIFDIEIGKNYVRDSIRRQLERWGFIRLQQSVWVYPYDCEEHISLLKTYFGVVKDLVYLTVEKIENDEWLREKFNLK